MSGSPASCECDVTADGLGRWLLHGRDGPFPGTEPAVAAVQVRVDRSRPQRFKDLLQQHAREEGWLLAQILAPGIAFQAAERQFSAASAAMQTLRSQRQIGGYTCACLTQASYAS